MGKKYHIAINAMQDTTAGWSLPMKEHCNTRAKPTAEPSHCRAACAGLLLATLLFSRGHPPQAGGGRKQQQPQQGKIKQKSTNKLKSVSQVPALTSSILLLLPLWQRRFPTPEGSPAAARVHWEEGGRVCFAGEATTFLQAISVALYLPTAAHNLAPQIRKAVLPILPIPPASEVWQLHVFWSWGQQHCAANECVAKSHVLLWCGSWPQGWRARHSTAAQAHGLSMHLL